MNAPDITLPELSEESIDRMEDAVFARISDERAESRDARAARGRSRRRGWLTAGGVAAAFVVGVLVTPPILGAVGASSGSSGSAAPALAPMPPGAGVYEAKSLADTSAAGGAAGGSVAADAKRDVIVSGSATVRVDDIRAAAEALDALAKKHDGFVESQQIGSSGTAIDVMPGGVVPPGGQDSGWVSIRVPSAAMPAVMAELKDYGTVLSSSVGQNDVTTATTDLRAQVDSLTASVARLTELMKQAASVADLLTAETALTDRQSQLESAQQQLKDLESQVAMSSVQVSLVREASAAADPAGFGDGLAAGWNGLIVSLNALVIALGFILPWLAVAAAVALIVWGIVRIRRSRRDRRRAAPERTAPSED